MYYTEIKHTVFCVRKMYGLLWRIGGGGELHHRTHIATEEASESHLQKTEDMMDLQDQSTSQVILLSVPSIFTLM